MNLDVPRVQETLRREGLDGWLLYDFRGVNPIMGRALGPSGMATRRLFVLIPATGTPTAIAHRIELQSVKGFPGEVRVYAAWQQLLEALASVGAGRTLAMEISPEDAVPYLDRVPWGVVKLLERLGVTVTSSAALVSEFVARWRPEDIADHRVAAEHLARIAQSAFSEIGAARSRDDDVTEVQVQTRILSELERAGLVTDGSPIVAFGAHAADPHYVPGEAGDAILATGEVILIDLWARGREARMFADQTWMAHAGSPPDEVARVWDIVRTARNTVVQTLREAARQRVTITGAALDDAARGIIREAGYEDAFVHRTGHAIDVELHGVGPHLDNFETHDTREVIPETGFSVEPGIYQEGRFGVRSEINVIMHAAGPEVTPVTPQEALVVVE